MISGHESKAMLNNGGPRYKRSKLERRMNSAVAWCVVFLVLMCFAGGLGSGLWLKSLDHSPEASSSTPPIFLDNRTNYNSPGFEGFLTFWTFVIILQVSIHSPKKLYILCILDIWLFSKTYRTTGLPVWNTPLTNIPKGFSSKMSLEVAARGLKVFPSYKLKTHWFGRFNAFCTKISWITVINLFGVCKALLVISIPKALK